MSETETTAGKPAPDTRYKRIGENIALARQMKGWEQVRLAELAGVSAQTISAIEGGRQRIVIDQLLAISDALRCKLSALLIGIDGT